MRILRDIEKQRKLDLASQKLARKLSAQVEIETSQENIIYQFIIYQTKCDSKILFLYLFIISFLI